uniref:calumenin-B-like n=1 Tax=Styela clava TaxID=7725 RepID=UPI001939CB02|nr:calumenin-B-like [Styela clava]
MSLLVQYFLLCILVISSSANLNLKVIGPKPSDQQPGSKGYDHDAFLGKETAKKFEELSGEESRRRLGIIFDKIDTDHDGIINEGEMEKWIGITQKRHIEEDTEKKMKRYDVDGDRKIKWDEYYRTTFGGLKTDEDWKFGEEEGFSYKDMHKRDRKRWEVADLDDDDHCTKTELTAFIHPQDFDHMREIVFEETMADIDRNGDGFLDLEEYINDVYKPETKGEAEPDWVATEREQFVNQRDKDQDGRLNEEEVRAWIMPSDYNYALAEAKHLIYESDSDQDGVLTKQEVVDHHDVFVGSQATQWGEIFNRHDEF